MQRLIDVALAEVGYLEKASNKDLYSATGNAGSKNYTKYAKELSQYSPGIYANGYAWCDTFADWCFVKAYGADAAKQLIHGWSAYTPTSASYYRSHGEWFTSPMVGDQIFFKNASGTICHTGIVYAVDDNNVYTVEGNTSSKSGVVANGGAVEKKVYKKTYSRIAGYGRPNYGLVKQPEKPKKPEVQTAPHVNETKKENDNMYKTVNDCPEWAREYVKKAVSSGYVKGTADGSLNLDDTKIWCLVVMMRIAGIVM